MILNLAVPTPGDLGFYRRWNKVGPTIKEIPKDPRDIRILVVDQKTNVTEQLLDKLPGLKYVCTATTGHTHIKADLESRGLTLVSLRGDTEFLKAVRSVSEFTMFLILKLYREYLSPNRTLAGKSIGIIGNGRIGGQVAEISKAFQMIPKVWDKEHSRQDLKLIFLTSDIVTIHLEENDQTKGLISRDLINLMKPGAVIINTARGSIVDEVALVDAVRTNKISGCAVDVIHNHDAFHKVDGYNILRSGHVAGSTLEDRVRTDERIVEKLKRLILSPDSKLE